MDDLFFIVLTFLFFAATGGLLAICAHLMEQKS